MTMLVGQLMLDIHLMVVEADHANGFDSDDEIDGENIGDAGLQIL